jgi:hypothetical protein
MATIQVQQRFWTLRRLQYLSSRSWLQYLASDTRRTSESDPKSSPQSV